MCQVKSEVVTGTLTYLGATLTLTIETFLHSCVTT